MNDQQEAFAQLFYANSQKLVLIQELKERVRVLEEALRKIAGADTEEMDSAITWIFDTQKKARQALEGGDSHAE